jgi:2-dehydropantoate 2-reductase
MKILSFGAGAIGTYIGGSLALAGHKLVFIEQPQVVDILKKRGLRLNLEIDLRRKGQAEYIVDTTRVEFVGSIEAALALGSYDVAIFALKSYDTLPALDGIRPFSDHLPSILCLQNGVDNELLLRQLVGADRVISGTVTSAIGRRAVGDVILEKLRGVGIAAGHPMSIPLVEAFEAAKLNCSLFPVDADMKWSKLLTNLLANPTSAILDMTAGEVYAHPGLYKLEIEQLAECLAVMRAQGINVVDLPGTPVKALAFATRLPLWISRPLLSKAAGAGRGAKMPSFHIDLHSGRGKSEVSYLHGAVVRAGEKFGINTPVNRLLTYILLEMTAGKIHPSEFSRKPEKLLSRL